MLPSLANLTPKGCGTAVPYWIARGRRDDPFVVPRKYRNLYLQHLVTARLEEDDGDATPKELVAVEKVARAFFREWKALYERNDWNPDGGPVQLYEDLDNDALEELIDDYYRPMFIERDELHIEPNLSKNVDTVVEQVISVLIERNYDEDMQ
jgi:hypothetical protein